MTEQVALGFRRLAIIDLETGNQPIFNESGTLALVANGEIYNFRALRRRLEDRGHRFATRSDAECIVHAYEEFGADCVLHLRGMFAFALWDEERRELLLARDRIGKKPLFYWERGGVLAFASELKALLSDPSCPRDIDLRSLDRYLTYRYVPGPESIIKGIRKLPAGHVLSFSAETGRASERRYWAAADSLRRRASTLSEVDAALRDAVALRMVSDVPLGAFLSGGIDSSIIVALMAGISSAPVRTFSIGFRELGFNELPYARKVAERYGTIHEELIVEGAVTDVLADLARYADEPLGDASALPTFHLARMTRKYVKVALSGDGGDEAFGGYRHYRRVLQLALARRFLEGVPGVSLKTAGRLARRLPIGERAARAVYDMGRSVAQAHARRMRLTRWGERRRLLTEEVADSVEDTCADTLLAERFSHLAWAGSLAQMSVGDIENVLVDDLMVKVDRMTMAHSLEARSPLLDQEVVDTALRLPDVDKLRWWGEGKRALRRLYGHLLPRELLNRPKTGFSVPVDGWFRDELRELFADIVPAGRLVDIGILSGQGVKNLFREHRNGQNHGHVLWSLAVLEMWCREVFVGAGAAPFGDTRSGPAIPSHSRGAQRERA